MMPTKLKGINLDEVSLVDVPAAQDATIAIWKRYGESDGMKDDMKDEKKSMDEMDDDMEGEGMDLDDLAERMAKLEAEIAAMTKRAEDAEAAKAAIEKAADAAGFDIAVADEGVTLAKRAEPEMIEIGGVKVVKSAVPEAVLKVLEDQAAELAKAQAREAELALEKRGAEELPHLAGTNLAKGRLLARVGDDADLLTALKAADAALASVAFKEIGDKGADVDPKSRLDAMVKSFATEKGVPYETAYAEVTKAGEGRDLFNAVRQTRN